jgi:S-adenosylmethionine:tRNA ribosyltransferase-isomerase
MTVADTKRRPRSATRLLVASTQAEITKTHHVAFDEITRFLRAGDLLVINDAGTLPASFNGVHERTGQQIEMRLAASLTQETHNPSRWLAVFFGAGDWRTPTELRLDPPHLLREEILRFDYGLTAKIESTLGRSAAIRFGGSEKEIWRLFYLAGRPIQYSHLKENLDLWDVQTPFSGAPVSLEPPSASFPLNWELMFELRKKGIKFTSLTHAAGLSCTGDSKLDANLPLPEYYRIPEKTAHEVNLARSEHRRVIAVGTTVVRALESAADENVRIKSGEGVATLKINPTYGRRVVTGILSGFHENGASHLKLLGSFLAPDRLAAIYREAEEHGYLCHEFGDSNLILNDA